MPPTKPRPALPGFEKIRRVWSPEYGRFGAQLLPGEFYVTREDELIATLLGSCVAACVRDPRTGMGGMNHFMLPAGRDGSSTAWIEREATRYGDFAMEQLINELIKRGAHREDLEIKLAGGGRMYDSHANVGQQNAEFAVRFLKQEGLRLLAQDLGGSWPRRVRYLPVEGSMRVTRLPPVLSQRVVAREKTYRQTVEQTSQGTGSIEFF
jgi:chemotaxis protein CheD